MDALEQAVYEMDAWMKTTTDPHYPGFIMYGDRKPHCWSGPARNFSPEGVACEEMPAANSPSSCPRRIYRWHPVDPRAGWVSGPAHPASMESVADPKTSMVSSGSTSARLVKATSGSTTERLVRAIAVS